jgi:hypothetical protein
VQANEAAPGVHPAKTSDANDPPRFPPPWSVEEEEAAYYVCATMTASRLAYVYFEEEPGRRSAAKLLPTFNFGDQNGFQVGLSVNFR